VDWQLAAVGMAVTLAAAFVGYSAWRTWFARAKTGCGGCSSGCKPTPAPAGPRATFVPAGELTVRRRVP
jgi:hypothetical protein